VRTTPDVVFLPGGRPEGKGPPVLGGSVWNSNTDGYQATVMSERSGRRRLLQVLGSAGLSAIAGCSGLFYDTPPQGTTDPTTETPTATETGTPTGTVTATPTPTTTGTATTTASTDGPGDRWPRFSYDPANTGHAPGHAAPVAGIQQRWAFETGNDVRSSPAVVDGTVYVGSMDGSVYAIDAADGTEQWVFETDNGVFSSPVVVEDTVYVGSWDNRVYALSASDGSEQWSFGTGDLVISSPAVAGGTVYAGSYDNHVYALSGGG